MVSCSPVISCHCVIINKTFNVAWVLTMKLIIIMVIAHFNFNVLLTFSQLIVCCLDFYCRAVFHLKGLHSAALSVDGFEGAGQRSPFKEGQVVVA